MCNVCNGKRYLICTRDDGRKAIEACAECSWFGAADPRTLFDVEAADLAQADGIACVSTSYPCYLIGEE